MSNPAEFSISRRRFNQLAVASAALSYLPIAGAQANVMRVRIGSDISNLDPARIFQLENQSVASHIFNGLVRYDAATNKLVPDLASSWQVEGGRTYTFKLREGVQWHKSFGAFTSDDVKFSIERVMNPATASVYASQFVSIESVSCPSSSTVVIKLKAPNSGFLHKVAAFNQGWIVSRKAVTAIGDDKVRLNPIGTGPFVFERWTPGQEVVLAANPAYFEGAPKLSGVVFRLIRDETAANIALQNGEIDVFFGVQQPEIIERLRVAKGVVMHDRPANHTMNLVLNCTVKPLDDVRVRQAIAHAVNRKALVSGFFKGTKREATSVLTPSFAEYTTDVPLYDFNPDKARALLKQAGVSGFQLNLVSFASSPYDKLIVPIANDLMAIGVQAKLNVLERGAYLQARAKGNVHTAITGIVGAPDPDNPILNLYSKAAFPPGMNTAHYAGVEDLIAAAAAAPESDRKKAYGAILKKTMTDVPVIPLYADHLFVAHSERVKNFVQNSMFTVDVTRASLG